MKYKCKENDGVIELGPKGDEIYISIDGDTAMIVIGVNDLFKALNEFGIGYEEEHKKQIRDSKILLNLAKDEIEMIKKQNSILFAKTDTLDRIYRLITMNNRDHHGAEACYPLERKIEDFLSHLENEKN